MAVSLKHAFTSTIADDADTSLVRPSNWNDEHTLTLAQGNILGRLTGAGTGAAVEIPVGFDSSGHMTLSAGSTSAAPLNLTSGTNLTSAAAGAIEYDGKVIYATPQGTQRGVVTGAQYYRLNSGVAGSNATGAQSLFGVGVTLSASTVYKFEAEVFLSKTAGATSHTISILFGGTATVNNIAYVLYSSSITTQSTYNYIDTSVAAGVVTQATATVSSTATAAAAVARHYKISGTVSINAGGTFIPQYQLSAAPGGAYTTNTNSTFFIYPVGAAGSNISVGAWA